MEKTNSKPSFRLVPLLDSFLRWVQKHFRLNGNVDVAKWYRITLSDALVCSALSQRFQEVLLTKLNRDRMRILKTSKSFRADFELRELMRGIPELSQFELSMGDPGLFLLRQRVIAPGGTEEFGEESYLRFESIEEVDEFFLTPIQYTFYSKRKKKFANEFAEADAKIEAMAKKYGLPGRFGHNAFVDHAGKPAKVKPNFNFLDNYGNPLASAGEDNNKALDEKDEVLESNELDNSEDEEDENDIDEDFDVNPEDLLPSDEMV